MERLYFTSTDYARVSRPFVFPTHLVSLFLGQEILHRNIQWKNLVPLVTDIVHYKSYQEPFALSLLGQIYLNGYTSELNYPWARHYFRASLKLRPTCSAAAFYARLLFAGKGGPRDLVEAERYAKLAIELASNDNINKQEIVQLLERIQAALSQNRVFKGDPEKAVNASPADLDRHDHFLSILMQYKDDLTEIEINRVRELLATLRDFHANNLEYCREIFSLRGRLDLPFGRSEKNRKIYLHPELAEVDFHERAFHFFKSFDMVFGMLEQRNKRELWIRFFREGFTEGLCLEGQVRSVSEKGLELAKANLEETHESGLIASAEKEIWALTQRLVQENQDISFDQLIEILKQQLLGKFGSDQVEITDDLIVTTVKNLGIF